MSVFLYWGKQVYEIELSAGSIYILDILLMAVCLLVFISQLLL